MILSAGPKNSGRHSLDLVLVALDCEKPEAVPIETIVYDIGTLQDLESLPSPKRGSLGQSFVEQSESLSVVHNWVALFERAGELLLQVALDRFSAEDAAPFVPALAEQKPINRWVHFLFASLSVHRRHLVEWTEEKTGRWGVLPSPAKSSIVEIDYLLNSLSRPTEEQPPEPAEATDDKDDTKDDTRKKSRKRRLRITKPATWCATEYRKRKKAGDKPVMKHIVQEYVDKNPGCSFSYIKRVLSDNPDQWKDDTKRDTKTTS